MSLLPPSLSGYPRCCDAHSVSCHSCLPVCPSQMLRRRLCVLSLLSPSLAGYPDAVPPALCFVTLVYQSVWSSQMLCRSLCVLSLLSTCLVIPDAVTPLCFLSPSCLPLVSQSHARLRDVFVSLLSPCCLPGHPRCCDAGSMFCYSCLPVCLVIPDAVTPALCLVTLVSFLSRSLVMPDAVAPALCLVTRLSSCLQFFWSPSLL